MERLLTRERNSRRDFFEGEKRVFRCSGVPDSNRQSNARDHGPIDDDRVESDPRAYGRELLLGIPGSGKTAHILNEVCEDVRAGVSGEEIAVVTFTRAARAEMRERLKRELPEHEFPWIRTIHSACRRLLGPQSGTLLDVEQLREFAERYSYSLSDVADVGEDEAYQSFPTETADDRLRFVYEWGRTRGLSIDEALARAPVDGVAAPQVRQYAERYSAWKAEHHLVDFADLLEMTLAAGLRPPVSIAFVDEAQDLSPIQVRLVEMWFRTCARLTVAGDDDQSVYVWHGADPGWLSRLAAEWPTRVLDRSHRVPSRIALLAQRIIDRNKARIAKPWQEVSAGGEILEHDRTRALALVDGKRSTLVLARNRMFLRPYSAALIETSVPFVVEGKGGVSPLSVPGIRPAVAVAVKISDGVKTICLGELNELVSCLSANASGLVHGTKAEIERDAKQHRSRTHTIDEFAATYGLLRLVSQIRAEGPLSIFTRLKPPERCYLQRLLDVHHELPEPIVGITSIHAAKGRQAQLVIVDSELTKATFKELSRGGQAGCESENRVFYVAVTRASETLVLVRPETSRRFDFPRLGDLDREHFEERAAILEYEAEKPRESAEREAWATRVSAREPRHA
jgi:superfamily I DNA/RNA helicase